jgi:hypothetical protein
MASAAPPLAAPDAVRSIGDLPVTSGSRLTATNSTTSVPEAARMCDRVGRAGAGAVMLGGYPGAPEPDGGRRVGSERPA